MVQKSDLWPVVQHVSELDGEACGAEPHLAIPSFKGLELGQERPALALCKLRHPKSPDEPLQHPVVLLVAAEVVVDHHSRSSMHGRHLLVWPKR